MRWRSTPGQCRALRAPHARTYLQLVIPSNKGVELQRRRARGCIVSHRSNGDSVSAGMSKRVIRRIDHGVRHVRCRADEHVVIERAWLMEGSGSAIERKSAGRRGSRYHWRVQWAQRIHLIESVRSAR